MSGWILLVEDNPDHALLIREALATAESYRQVCHAADGQAALDLLRQPNADPPAAVILDLQLPKLNGLEVLRAMRAEGRLATVPVYVLTTSTSPADAAACRAGGAAAYLTKPAGFELLSQLGFAVAARWPYVPG